MSEIHEHRGDLPEGLDFGDAVAVDTETMGLAPHRDRLCLVQLSAGDGVCHLVKFDNPRDNADAYAAPRLKALLVNQSVTKLFHFARFDVAVLAARLGVATRPVFCTKIASRLARTYTDRHGLKDLCRELLGVELSKQQQCSDWGAETLSAEQRRYAAADVAHLHRLRDILRRRLEREGRLDLARACFAFVPTRARLDLSGWRDTDIFAH